MVGGPQGEWECAWRRSLPSARQLPDVSVFFFWMAFCSVFFFDAGLPQRRTCELPWPPRVGSVRMYVYRLFFGCRAAPAALARRRLPAVRRPAFRPYRPGRRERRSYWRPWTDGSPRRPPHLPPRGVSPLPYQAASPAQETERGRCLPGFAGGVLFCVPSRRSRQKWRSAGTLATPLTFLPVLRGELAPDACRMSPFPVGVW